jgi:hypothetical protein
VIENFQYLKDCAVKNLSIIAALYVMVCAVANTEAEVPPAIEVTAEAVRLCPMTAAVVIDTAAPISIITVCAESLVLCHTVVNLWSCTFDIG